MSSGHGRGGDGGSHRICEQGEVGKDGRLTAEEMEGEVHPLISGPDAVALGLISESYRQRSMYCAYKFCKLAAANKDKACGEKSGSKQKPRAVASAYCMHPSCKRGYHPSCYSVVHRFMQHGDLP